jgi:hypothetical protein
MPFCAIIGMLMMGGIGATFVMAAVFGGFTQGFTSGSDPLDVYLLVMPLIVSLQVGGALVRFAWVAFAGWRSFERQYRETLQYLVHTDYGALAADEEYWRPILKNLNPAVARRINAGPGRHTIERQLEFAALFRMALVDLLGGLDRLRWISITRGAWLSAVLYQARFMGFIAIVPVAMFVILGVSIGGIVGMGGGGLNPAMLLPMLIPLVVMLLMPAVLVASHGPSYANYHGSLAAHCDFVLDTTRLDLISLEPPSRRLHPLVERWFELEEWLRRTLRGGPPTDRL